MKNKKKIEHKIVEGRDWGFTLFMVILVNLVVGGLVFLMSHIIYQVSKPTTGEVELAVLITLFATFSMALANFRAIDIYKDNYFEKVEHIIK